MALRDYQIECCRRVREEFQTHNSTLVQQATGCGKTETFLHLAHDHPGRTIIMAHMDELIKQPYNRYRKMFGEAPGLEKAQDIVLEDMPLAHRKKVVLTSVQTMRRENRHKKFDPRDFDQLVIDECHHSPTNSYQRVIDYFRKNDRLKILGVTATPKRSDMIALGKNFETVAFTYPILRAIDDGWLVPIHQQVVKVQGLDFSNIRTVRGDLDKDDLERILIEEKALHQVAKPAVDLCGDKPTLVFCVSRAHANMMAKVIDRYKHGSAQDINGDRKEFPMLRRQQILKDFREGKIQFLCSCQLLLEGFDAPCASNLIMARPTKSPVVYEQALGRITRRYGVSEEWQTKEERRAAISRSQKPFGVAYDFVGNAGRHKICQAADILGGKYGVPVREYAKKTLLEEGKQMSIEDALERADAELLLEAEDEKWMERRRILAERAQYQTHNVSPFAGSNNVSMSVPEPSIAPTEKQVRYLRLLVCRGGEGDYWTEERIRRLTKRQCTGIIAKFQEGYEGR